MLRRFLPLALLLFGSAWLQAEKIVLVAGGGGAEKNAPALQCQLREPFGVEFTSAGEMIIVEMTKGQRVLKVDKAGLLTVLAGTGEKGYSGDGGPASAATFNGIHNLVIPPSGEVLLSDSFNHVLRRIDPKTQVISTLAGDGTKGFRGDGGPMAQAQFSTLIHISLDPAGKYLYAADIGNRRVRRMDLVNGTIQTVAGNGQKGLPADGADAATSPLVDPRAAIGDAEGGFYILERDGHALRYVDAKGRIKTVVGTGQKGLSGDGGPAVQATMNGPKHLCLDRDGTVLIADAENHVIRRYSPKTGQITRVAGTGRPGAGGFDGDPLKCELRRPHGVTIGPEGVLYITDSYNDRILKIVP